jgi:hypothetical protein
MKPMRGRAKSLQKSWRVLSVALAALLATTCLEWCRDHSPQKTLSGKKAVYKTLLIFIKKQYL